jgi:hypothetical protein
VQIICKLACDYVGNPLDVLMCCLTVFQIIGCFYLFRCIIFAMHIDAYYV